MSANRPGAVTVLSSAARTATPVKVAQLNSMWRGGLFIIDVSAVPGSAPSVVPTIQGRDPVSGNYYTILTGVPITAVGTTVLRVDTALTAAANTIAKDFVPTEFAVDMVHGNANSVSYTVCFVGFP